VEVRFTGGPLTRTERSPVSLYYDHNLKGQAHARPSKLQSELSYQSVIDDMRRTVATEFLQNTHLLIDQVAERVGFSDATRAHRIAFIHQAQRPKLIPYGKVALERCVAGRGAKLAFNELGAISFTMRGRGDRTAT